MNKSIQTAQKWLADADAILVTASNGFSISEGLNLFADDQKLRDVLGDLVDKYHLTSLLMALSFHYPNRVDQWRAYSRVINYYGLNYRPGQLIAKLREIVKDKPSFIWTSNVDHHFALAGFEHLLELEGNWLTGVCSADAKKHPVVDLTETIRKIHEKDQQGTLTEADLPTCQQCGAPLALNTAGDHFQMNQDQVSAFENFVTKYQRQNIVVLELGIGPNNQLIKAPSMQLVAGNKQSHYITVNKGQVMIANNIADRSVGFSSTIEEAFNALLTGQDHGLKIQGPTKPQPPLTPEQKKKQDQLLQMFYPHLMINRSVQPGQLSMYVTIDSRHPSYLHLVSSGESWMYSMGDAAIAHCFTQDGHYYQVRLGLNKQQGEVHGFYLNAGTFVAFESANDAGVGFSQLNASLPANGNSGIMVPNAEQLIKYFPKEKPIIQRLTAREV